MFPNNLAAPEGRSRFWMGADGLKEMTIAAQFRE